MTVENMAWAAGPLIGGVIVATSGTSGVLDQRRVLRLLGVAPPLIAANRLQSEVPLSRGHWRDLADGLALARRSPAVQLVLAAWSVQMLGVACINVGEVVIAKASFHAGDFGFGLLFAASGVGLAVGSFAGGMLAERRAIGSLYGPAIVLAGLGYGIAAVAPNVWLASPAVVLAGVGNGAAALYNVLLIQRGVPDAYRGRAFTIAMSVTYAILGPAMAAAGIVTTALGGRWIWGIGAACWLSGLVAIALAPRLRTAPAVTESRSSSATRALRSLAQSALPGVGYPHRTRRSAATRTAAPPISRATPARQRGCYAIDAYRTGVLQCSS